MSGVNFNSTSYSTRLIDIESALVNPKSNKKVDTSLKLVNKENGFVRFLKIMVLPLARFFGADPFGHTRANKVATALLSQYQKFETELSAEDKNRLSRIVKTLDKKTKGRYNKIMNVFIAMIPVDSSIPTPTFTPLTPSLTPSVPMGEDGKPLPPPPPPPVDFSQQKPPAIKGGIGDELANFLKGPGLKKADETTQEDGSTEAKKKPVGVNAGGNDALQAQLAAVLVKMNKNKGEGDKLKPTKTVEKPVVKSEETDGESDPWAVFGAKKNTTTTQE